MIKKFLVALVLLMTSSHSFAEFYIGTGYSKSILHYDTHAELNNSIAENGYELQNLLLNRVGSPIIISESFSSDSTNFLVGYKISKNWSVELDYFDLGTYSARAQTGYSGTLSNFDISIGDYLNVSDVNLDGRYRASYEVDITGYKISLLYSSKTSEKTSIYSRFGISKMDADITNRTIIDYSYSYIKDNDTFSGSGSQEKVKYSGKSGAVPNLAFGMSFDISQDIDWRIEYGRHGVLNHTPYFSSISTYLIYGF